MNPKDQKFHYGDLIYLPPYKKQSKYEPSMEHFTWNCRGIITGSYADKYGGEDIKNYTVFLENIGECSWYPEQYIELIQEGRIDLLNSWRDELRQRDKNYEDINWVLKNFELVKKEARASCILTLFKFINFPTNFIRNGEYYILYLEWEKLLPFFDLMIKKQSYEELLEKGKGYLNPTAKLKEIHNKVQTILGE